MILGVSDIFFQRIVVGVELDARAKALGSGSRRALDQARWIAGTRTGVHVTILHSTCPDERWDAGERDFIPVDGGGSPEAEEVLESAAANLRDAGIEVEIAFVEESGALAITHRVLAENADLVIVGTRAENQHDRRRIGSIAGKLLRECPSAVWAVKPDARTVPRTIVAATDLSPVGTRVVRTAAAIAESAGSELHVVHAMQLTMAVELRGPEAEAEYMQKMRAAAVEQITSELGPAGERAELHVAVHSPTRALRACEERLVPDLVVMGTVSRGGVAGLLIGNTAERLLGQLDSSILTIKPEDFICPAEIH